MSKSLESLTVGKLLNAWEVKSRAEDKTCTAVYALAAHGNERFSEICARLGEDHATVVKYRAASDAIRLVELECRRRYGPAAQYRSLWPLVLRQQMKGRK